MAARAIMKAALDVSVLLIDCIAHSLHAILKRARTTAQRHLYVYNCYRHLILGGNHAPCPPYKRDINSRITHMQMTCVWKAISRAHLRINILLR